MVTFQGFPNGVNWRGGNLGKMAKNCMKMTKLAFLGQNNGGDMGGQANFSVSGGIPPSLPPLGKPCLSWSRNIRFFSQKLTWVNKKKTLEM